MKWIGEATEAERRVWRLEREASWVGVPVGMSTITYGIPPSLYYRLQSACEAMWNERTREAMAS